MLDSLNKLSEALGITEPNGVEHLKNLGGLHQVKCLDTLDKH